jgi:hypothetical protein
MSPATASAAPPASLIPLTVSSSFSCRLPETTTRAPSPANAVAIARPIPVPPPVTIATLFFSLTGASPVSH